MILDKRARTNERRRKILRGGGGRGVLRYAPPEKFWNFSPQKCFFHYPEGLLVSCYKFLLKSATTVITKCDRYNKGRQFYCKVR